MTDRSVYKPPDTTPMPTVLDTEYTALTTESFLSAWSKRVEAGPSGLNSDDRRYFFYAKYNLDRLARVEARYAPSSAFREAVDALPPDTRWVFITEDWCLDATYVLPLVTAASDIRNDVELHVVGRDSNPDLMDHFAKPNGARSIPVLAIFDSDGAELLRWGSRCAELNAVRSRWKEEGCDGAEIERRSIEWYADEGWLSIESELAQDVLSISTTVM